jgi:hypothetical protein
MPSPLSPDVAPIAAYRTFIIQIMGTMIREPLGENGDIHQRDSREAPGGTRSAWCGLQEKIPVQQGVIVSK